MNEPGLSGRMFERCEHFARAHDGHQRCMMTHPLLSTYVHELRKERHEQRGVDGAVAEAQQIKLTHERLLFRTYRLLGRIAAVRAGAGIRPCHVWLARRYPELVQMMPDWDVATLPVWVVAHDDLKPSSRLRLVFDHFVAELRAAFSPPLSVCADCRISPTRDLVGIRMSPSSVTRSPHASSAGKLLKRVMPWHEACQRLALLNVRWRRV